jgi:predicted RNA-binding Zn-ribbon protein involved in translation (DUF1610 family)
MIDLRVVTNSYDGATPASCPHCGDAVHVRPVVVRSVERGVRYWGCERCGLVWGVVTRTPSEP